MDGCTGGAGAEGASAAADIAAADNSIWKKCMKF